MPNYNYQVTEKETDGQPRAWVGLYARLTKEEIADLEIIQKGLKLVDIRRHLTSQLDKYMASDAFKADLAHAKAEIETQAVEAAEKAAKAKEAAAKVIPEVVEAEPVVEPVTAEVLADAVAKAKEGMTPQVRVGGHKNRVA